MYRYYLARLHSIKHLNALKQTRNKGKNEE